MTADTTTQAIQWVGNNLPFIREHLRGVATATEEHVRFGSLSPEPASLAIVQSGRLLSVRYGEWFELDQSGRVRVVEPPTETRIT